jgi:hypothetical protein
MDLRYGLDLESFLLGIITSTHNKTGRNMSEYPESIVGLA